MRLDSLPLFSLEAVLYPDEVLPLHIFEPKYRLMIDHCIEQDIPFGVILNKAGAVQKVGCTARVSKVVETFETGEKNIIVTGLERFRVIEVFRSQPYLTADIETIMDVEGAEYSQLRERVIAQHIKLLELAGRTPSPVMYQERSKLSFFIAHNAGLTIEQKQDVLELEGEGPRISYLIQHLERFIPAVEEAETIRKKVRSNGHFKDFPPEADD